MDPVACDREPGSYVKTKNRVHSLVPRAQNSKFILASGLAYRKDSKHVPGASFPVSSLLSFTLAVFSVLPALPGPCLCDCEPLERKMSLGPRTSRKFTLMGPS